MIGVKQIGGNGGGSEQDNIDIVRYFSTGTVSTSRLVDTITSILLYQPQFEIDKFQSAWFNFLFSDSVTVRYKMVKKGKGTYGVGATPISFSDLHFISSTGTTVADLEENPTTAKYFIQDLGGLTISEFVNAKFLGYLIKDKEQGETIFKVGIEPDFVTYWFVGDAGIYGEGLLQSQDSDFEMLSEQNPSNIKSPKYRELIQSKEQLLGELRNDTVYAIDGDFTLLDGEFITHKGNLTFDGWGFDISRIRKNAQGESIFKTDVAGGGNLSLSKLEINSGLSSVFDNTDSTGNHAIEINDVNFQNCSSIGRLRNFRQFTGTTLGFYGCGNGLRFSGTWNGFKLTNTNCFTFGNGGTLFRKDADTIFKNRFFSELNADFPLGSKLSDFVEANFQSDELFQINSSMIKYNGTINDTNASALVPNLSANNRKCLWRSNVGLPDTALEKFVEDNAVIGNFVVNWLYDTYILTMTGNTLFSETNLPASGKNTEELKIFLQGNFTPTFPASWNANKVGTFKKGELNQITLKFLKSGLYFMKIDNSLTIYPAPDVSSVTPASLLPGQTTQEFRIFGSFFTPATIVSIEGQTVNSVTFINQGELQLSVTAGMTEGNFDLIISNGTQVTYVDKIVVVLGITYEPSEEEWTDLQNDPKIDEIGIIEPTVFNQASSAIWKTIPAGMNFRITAQSQALFDVTGHDNIVSTQGDIQLLKTSDNSVGVTIYFRWYETNFGTLQVKVLGENGEQPGNPNGKSFMLERRNSIWRLYINNALVNEFSTQLNEELKIKCQPMNLKLNGIRFIELET